MNNYPVVIESGTGERLTFTRRYTKNDVEVMEAINMVEPGSGPPMHIHYLQDESLTVIEGLLAAQTRGEEIKYYHPGETVFFARGIPHKFWNAGSTPLTCKGFISPVYNVEYFLSAIYQSTKNGGKKRPQTFDAAFLLHRYKSEFDMLDIPWFVRRVIFPIARVTGKIRGMHKKYADAPPPVMN